MVGCELFRCTFEAEWFVVIGRYQPTIEKYNIVTGTTIEDFRVCSGHAAAMNTEPWKYAADRVLLKPMAMYTLCPNCGRNGIPEDDIWCFQCLDTYQAGNIISPANVSSPNATSSLKSSSSADALNKTLKTSTTVSHTQTPSSTR